eukprot:1159453-Pelagomonas_calceolata.AAC.2
METDYRMKDEMKAALCVAVAAELTGPECGPVGCLSHSRTSCGDLLHHPGGQIEVMDVMPFLWMGFPCPTL